MANTIKIKQSAVASKVPTTAQLALGELAINTWDGKLFLKKDNGTASIVEVGAGASGGIPTGITGILKSDGSGAVSAAVPGTDYPDLNGSNTFNSGSQALAWTDTGGTVGPSMLLYRNRASPAASDTLGGIYYQGNSSTGTLRNFVNLYAIATTVTNGAEDGELVYRGIASGAVAERVRFGADGVIRTKTNASANTGVVISKHWTSLTADYTLTNTASGQKLFNNPTNGRLTLPTGVYEFDCLLYVTTMSATTGNMQFSLVGAGTATTDRIIYHSVGSDSSTPTTGSAAGSSVSVASVSGAVIVTTGTGTGLAVSIRGMFRVTAAGTIIPSCLLTTAAAAVVKAGSYFKCAKIGETTESFVGAWA